MTKEISKEIKSKYDQIFRDNITIMPLLCRMTDALSEDDAKVCISYLPADNQLAKKIARYIEVWNEANIFIKARTSHITADDMASVIADVMKRKKIS